MSYRWVTVMGRVNANTPHLRIPSRDHISYSISFKVLGKRENSIMAQGVMKRPLPLTISGRDLEERGLELPLPLLKCLSFEMFPPREMNGDTESFFCCSSHRLIRFVGVRKVKREVRVIETLIDEVSDPSCLVYPDQRPENLPPSREA